MDLHTQTLLDQFTRQAIPFSNSSTMNDAGVLNLMTEMSGAGPGDAVLDVACGPGLVVAAFAKVAAQVTGIDFVPAMIERAEGICKAQGLANVRFDVGDVTRLPYPDAAFTHVVTRYALHHMQEPLPVLREMARCCKPGGRILVVDGVAPDDPVKAAAFNRVEMFKDPSHVEFRPVGQLVAWIQDAGLKLLRTVAYPVNLELEAVLARSFPREGDADRMRQAFAAALEHDDFGIGLHRVGNELRYAHPAVALLAERVG